MDTATYDFVQKLEKNISNFCFKIMPYLESAFLIDTGKHTDKLCVHISWQHMHG